MSPRTDCLALVALVFKKNYIFEKIHFFLFVFLLKVVNILLKKILIVCVHRHFIETAILKNSFMLSVL